MAAPADKVPGPDFNLRRLDDFVRRDASTREIAMAKEEVFGTRSKARRVSCVNYVFDIRYQLIFAPRVRNAVGRKSRAPNLDSSRIHRTSYSARHGPILCRHGLDPGVGEYSANPLLVETIAMWLEIGKGQLN